MYTLLGWLVVETAADETDPAALEDTRTWLLEEIPRSELGSALLVEGRGGLLLVTARLVQNRELGETVRLLTLLEELGRRATGSYGLIHARDTDVSPEFDVIVVARGVVSIQTSTYFAPAVPTIEDG